MPLEIKGSFTVSRPDPAGEIKSDRHLWLDKTRKIVVEDEDPRAAHLLVATNGTIPASEAERLGLKLVGTRLTQPEAEKVVVHAKPHPEEAARQKVIAVQQAAVTERREARKARRKPKAAAVKAPARKQAKK